MMRVSKKLPTIVSGLPPRLDFFYQKARQAEQRSKERENAADRSFSYPGLLTDPFFQAQDV